MSAIRNPRRVDRWLTIAAVVALVYALGLFGFGLVGHLWSARSPAHWIGRIGTLVVILGVLVYQRAGELRHGDDRAGASSARGAMSMRRPASMRDALRGERLGPSVVVAGLLLVVAGFALGVIGY